MPGKKREDKKKKALLEQSCFNPRAEQVTDNLFREEGFFDPKDLVQVKYEMLRKVGVDKRPVTEAAQNEGTIFSGIRSEMVNILAAMQIFFGQQPVNLWP